MGFLDNLLSKIGRVPKTPLDVADVDADAGGAPPASSVKSSPTPAKPAPAAVKPSPTPASFLASGKSTPGGPLRLAVGDLVTHYRVQFIMVGLRVLEGDGSTVFHYCLREKDGASAVLVAEDCPDPVYSLQRPVKGAVRWDADVLTDVADEPFRVAQRGKMKVRAWDDAGIPAGVRSMEYREFEDGAGDRVLVLEDYQGKREVRVGEPVFEAEMEFQRAATRRPAGILTAALDGARFEEAAEDDIVRGSPRAAAKALEQNVGPKRREQKTGEIDRDPTAYDDESWADARDEAPEIKSLRARAGAKARIVDDEEDEWVSATQLVRRNGDGGGEEDASIEA